jgi:hypothetical protein
MTRTWPDDQSARMSADLLSEDKGYIERCGGMKHLGMRDNAQKTA